jgi:hypothetical protein
MMLHSLRSWAGSGRSSFFLILLLIAALLTLVVLIVLLTGATLASLALPLNACRKSLLLCGPR